MCRPDRLYIPIGLLCFDKNLLDRKRNYFWQTLYLWHTELKQSLIKIWIKLLAYCTLATLLYRRSFAKFRRLSTRSLGWYSFRLHSLPDMLDRSKCRSAKTKAVWLGRWLREYASQRSYAMSDCITHRKHPVEQWAKLELCSWLEHVADFQNRRGTQHSKDEQIPKNKSL